ncbi:MAG: carbon-nitrogen hydrolase family protein [Candidatus Hydrogenedentes bacterium]|jgi:predicted amidohydrolase|nr:carbon-nitrogen hydrolase family protein [Candidatus Hydrogenedentota bacterium]
MRTIRIAGIQMNVSSSKKDNLPRILGYIRQGDCDFLLFPEMSLTGYHNNFNEERTKDAWKQIAAACRQSYVTAIIGTGVIIDGKNCIQSRIYTDEGQLLGTHEKIVPTEADRKWCVPGEELRVFNYKDCSFGCLIGNDLWVAPGKGPYPDPRLSFQLGKKGAQIIFHSMATGTDSAYAAYYQSNLALRARESNVFIVTANTAVESGQLNMPSGIMSPEGKWLIQSKRSDEFRYTYDLEIE